MTGAEFQGFSQALTALAELADREKDNITDEAKTKSWLVEPFLKELHYDKSIPSQVVPEYPAGYTDDAKADYALLDAGDRPMILVECKKLGTDLSKHVNQLAGYFTFSDAQISILTDGVAYNIYSDAVKPNVMDNIPLFTFDLVKSDDDDRRPMARLARLLDGSFDKDGFEDAVKEWELTKKIKPAALRIFESWRTETDDELVRLLEDRLDVSDTVALSAHVTGWFAEFVSGNQIAPPPPPPGGVPLPDWQISNAADMPSKLVFPDGTHAEIKKGYDVAVKTAEWLIGNNHLTPKSLPLRSGKDGKGKLHLISDTPFHPDGSKIRMAREASGYFVSCSHGAPSQVVHSMMFIERAGLRPEDFLGVWKKS